MCVCVCVYIYTHTHTHSVVDRLVFSFFRCLLFWCRVFLYYVVLAVSYLVLVTVNCIEMCSDVQSAKLKITSSLSKQKVQHH
jgi:hypothetical protein